MSAAARYATPLRPGHVLCANVECSNHLDQLYDEGYKVLGIRYCAAHCAVDDVTNLDAYSLLDEVGERLSVHGRIGTMSPDEAIESVDVLRAALDEIERAEARRATATVAH